LFLEKAVFKMGFAEMLFSEYCRKLSRKYDMYTLFFQDFVSIVEKFGGQNILYLFGCVA
jgi:hypothetical protein